MTATYGLLALEQLRDVVRTAKADDAMATVTILLPNNIAGIVARRYLAREGLDGNRRGIAALKLGTLPRLAEQIAAPSLVHKRPATGPIVSAAWRESLDADPGLFKEVAAHPATVRALVGAHRELRDLTPQALDAVAAHSKLTADLVRLHRAVTNRLEPQWYDQTDLLHQATKLCAEKPRITAEFGVLILYVPQALSQAEASFATALAAHGDLQVVAALAGDARADATVIRTLQRLGRIVDAADSTDPVLAPESPLTGSSAGATPAIRPDRPHSKQGDHRVRC